MGCVFCQIVAGESPAHIVAEDQRCLAFMDIAPLSRGHVLVVPRAHSSGLLDMSPDDGAAVMRTTLRVAAAVNTALRPDGMNLFHATGEAAGQSVFHAHLHVVPRWHGDGFRPPIIPERVQDDALDETAALIRAHL